MDKVDCNGEENNLKDCQLTYRQNNGESIYFHGWGHDTKLNSHQNDVVLKCYSKTTTRKLIKSNVRLAYTDSCACSWCSDSGKVNILVCKDGSECDVELDGWTCCKYKGGRAKCPINKKYMCKKENSCANTSDHCCGVNCVGQGGNLECNETSVIIAGGGNLVTGR